MYYTGKRVMRFAENNSVVPPRPARPSPECSKLGCRFASTASQYAAELPAGGVRRDAVCCANIFSLAQEGEGDLGFVIDKELVAITVFMHLRSYGIGSSAC